MNRTLYALHRWVAAAAFLQLALWTLSGCFFAVVPITTVRGGFVAGAHEALIEGPVLPIPVILATLRDQGAPTSLELRGTPSGPFYVARIAGVIVRVDARTGGVAPVEQAEAEGIARRDQSASPGVRSASLLSEGTVEYRGKSLPAWRVALDDAAGTVVYVDARTGDVTARRNDTWRIYDFLWSLHIMDYRDRESFNHPLIMAASALAVATVWSGLVLWIARAWRAVRRGRDQP